MLAKVDMPPRSGSPPEHMPANMMNEYLMNNHAHLRLMYEGGTVSHGKTEPHHWSIADIEDLMSRARKGESFSYTPDETSAIYRALKEYPVENLHGLVLGSQTPWVEAILLVAGQSYTSLHENLSMSLLSAKTALLEQQQIFTHPSAGPGATKLTTVEYMPTTSSHSQIVPLTPGHFAKQWLEGDLRTVDFVFTFSSIEHDGLGRYGDPLDATGDLKDVEMLSCVIKPGGLLYLGVPVGPDAVVFNVHRIYGFVRLPMLTANFKVLNVICPGNMTLGDLMSLEVGAHMQPTIVLQNQRQAPCKF